MADAMPRMQANFHKTLRNPTVPGGAVDMWEMASEDGETILSVAVVHGRMDLPRRMATACNAHADLLKAAKLAYEIMSKHRLASMDQNPKGVMDILGSAIAKATVQ